MKQRSVKIVILDVAAGTNDTQTYYISQWKRKLFYNTSALTSAPASLRQHQRLYGSTSVLTSAPASLRQHQLVDGSLFPQHQTTWQKRRSVPQLRRF